MLFIDCKTKLDIDKLKEAGQLIKDGKLVIFPTETVYGIGTNGLLESAVEKIFSVKKRHTDNPINLLVHNIDMVNQVAKDISPLEYKLIKTFSPGPFTIILNKKDIVPNIVTANSNKVGIRIPDNEIALKLLELANCPIAAPSANISGELSSTKFSDLSDDFKDKVDCMIDGGDSSQGIESTIVQVIENKIHILRPGKITIEKLREIGKVPIIKDYETSANTPGGKYEHYSINCPKTIVYSDNTSKMVEEIIMIANKYKNPLILACTENVNLYSHKVITYGSKNNLDEISKNLFSSLKHASNLSPDILIIEGVKQEGIGIAIMNILSKNSNIIIL